MPKNARIFLAEDNEIFRDDAKRALEEAGHTVVKVVTTLEEFLPLRAELPKLGIDVAILDNNLSPDGCEGELIAPWFKRHIKGVKIIAYSSSLCDFGNIAIRKGREHLNELCEAVENL